MAQREDGALSTSKEAGSDVRVARVALTAGADAPLDEPACTARNRADAPTGAAARLAVGAPTEACAITSTPFLPIAESVTPAAQDSPPRTRSGILRIEKPKKRARLARVDTAGDTGGAPRNTGSPAGSRDNNWDHDTRDLGEQFAGLGLQRPHCKAPMEAQSYFSQGHVGHGGPNGNSTRIGGIFQSYVPVSSHANSMSYARAHVPSLAPCSGMEAGQRTNVFSSTAVPNLFSNFGSFGHTAPTTFNHPNTLNTNISFPQTSQADITLSSSQVAARQVMSKDLPTFYGNPEEWPLFITNYDQSTERCGFTDQENLIRLQKCLKGPALAAVRGKLMMPSTVSFAIETLRMLYGRPDVIHQTLQSKLRQRPNVRMEKMETLIDLALAVQNYRTTMQAMGLGGYLNDPMLLNELLSKLPCDLKLDWGRFRVARGHVDIQVFDEWLFNLAMCVSQITPQGYTPTTSVSTDETRSGRRQRRERVMLHDVMDKSIERRICPNCAKDHHLMNCDGFRAMGKDTRWGLVREKKLCICCFGTHFVRRCSSKRQCGVDGCTMIHNSLLHMPRHNATLRPSISAVEAGNMSNSTILFHAKGNRHILFRYIAVTLHGKDKSVDTYAFIDEGSACTLIEHDLAVQLGLDGPTQELCLQWTGEITQNEVNSKLVSLSISSQEAGGQKFSLSKVRTISGLNLPVQSFDDMDIRTRDHLKNLPIQPYEAAQARILIGLDNIKLGVPSETREGEADDLIAAKCKIGWSVYGRNVSPGSPFQRILHICDCSDDRLETLVKSYFSLDAVGIRAVAPLVSKEDERSRQIMESTTKYLPLEKRWETGLLWRHDHIELPDSRPMAQRRLQCLEAKMARDPNLKLFLTNSIRDYEQKGYVRRLTQEEVTSGGKSWYIPMFTVTNINKNKTRLVWDAAAAINNTALNSVLLKGPDLLKSLVGVLIRFRERPIALCGDIREMFHQVRVIQEDQAAQKFLWRDGDNTRDPDVYVMQVMTFGASCSPSSANYVKNKNAERFMEQHPAAVQAIKDNTFVDDWLQSVTTEEEAIHLATTVRKIHAEGGFEMRHWISNSKKVLLALSGQTNQVAKFIEEPDTKHEKVLGMWWSPGGDILTFFEKFPAEVFDERRAVTKRQMLRVIMTVFDPLGLLGFFMIYAKVLLQEVWRSGVSWDEPVGTEVRDKWSYWVRHLRTITKIRIPRCYPLACYASILQLHTFVDASVDAYAATSYLRADYNGEIQCCLIATKTRVAPLKPISIPRLELMAAILGLRLAKFIADESSVVFHHRVFWSDSKNVLCWINSDARKFQQFVAVRIGEILEDSRADEWRWVPSANNVADEGTKWTNEPEFSADSRWFVGPTFLSLTENAWPKNDTGKAATIDDEQIFHVDMQQTAAPSLAVVSPDPQRFSKWEKLRNSQRCVLRFLHIILRRTPLFAKLTGLVGEFEVEDAERVIIRNCQQEVYDEEIKCLTMGKGVQRRSNLFKSSPYLDEAGLLRVRGRIDAITHVPWDTRRPIILPRKHRVTDLIVEFYYRKFHHHHNEIVVNELRQRYWIPGLRALVRATTKGCQLCRNRRATPLPPEMGSLPPERLSTFTRPFTNTGVDYFGPFEVVIGRRREKRWGVLFTCLTVRAVHIEISPSLSTDSFLLVLKQFTSRRGLPKCIWSDNGTNFRGACRVLVDEIQRLSKDELEQRVPDIKWRFLPPAAPHMGGCWERMVRSVKSILMDILPKTGLREEVLRAALADVEFILNSRPLTNVPLDSADAEAITPNHFLLGSSSGSRDYGIEGIDGLALRKNFKIATEIANTFWRRWIREYLPCLTRRGKWHQNAADPITVNDVVLIVDENAKRNSWQRGLVVDVNVGRDGEARSAVVKTINGLLTRPAVKLAKLDVKG